MTAPAVPPATLAAGLAGAAAGEALTGATLAGAQVALSAAFTAQAAAVRALTAANITALWEALGRWTGDRVPEFVDAVLPIMTAGQAQIAQLTAAHLAGQVSLARDGRLDPEPVELPFDPAELNLRGLAPEDEWRRPFQATWTDLARGKSLPLALDSGRRRAETLAVTDLQLTKTRTAREVLTREPSVVGYRRVLSGRESCARCALASTQRYRKEDLLPIHPGCDCGVAPIIGDRDPGRVLNPDLAERIHEMVAADLGEEYVDAGGRSGPLDYRDLIVTHEHGEIGPVLAVRGHEFAGPESLTT